MNKKILWVIIVLLVLAAALGGFYCYKVWWPQRQAMISLGLAEPTFPWRAYTQEELNKLYPQVKYADVPTRVTPEQTYANFREALRTNNLEMALEQIGTSSGTNTSKEAANNLRSFYQENKFKELYNRYPEKIEKENMYESIAQYKYEYYSSQYKQQLIGSMNFIKDSNGDWKMDSL